MSDDAFGSSVSVEKHLDQLEILTTTFVVPAVIVFVAASNIPNEFEIVGIHVTIGDAYGIVVAIYDCLILLFATTCWKAADLLKACDKAEAGRAMLAVITHKWLLNPFSYSGAGALSILSCAVGPALLALAWWVGLSGLKLLSSVTHDIGGAEKLLYALYLVVTVVALIGVIRMFRIILTICKETKTGENIPVRPRSFFFSCIAKCVSAGLGSVLGLWLYYALVHLA